jgi:transcriptional regulator GlxA family with amidase domain
MPRRVVLLTFPEFQALDLTGPLEVFALADTGAAGSDRRYRTEITATTKRPTTSASGLSILPHRDTAQTLADPEPIDTLIVVGGDGTRGVLRDPGVIDFVRAAAARARRTASVCSGAFVLAEAGLLDGRRAVTHWGWCDSLADRYPAVTVDPDPIFVHDGPIWTSAGVTAGIDLALALVEDDHGPDLARTVARQLVVFVQRPGGQAQFSTQLAAQRPHHPGLRDVQDWITDHLADDLSLPALAAHAALSERHFSRLFRAETGTTAAAYVEAARVEAARLLLETTGDGLDRIARTCGFGTVETMHRTFNRTLRVTPGDYRRHFGTR